MICWQCGKKFLRFRGKEIFVIVVLPGGNEVKTHKACEKGTIACQRFDTFPDMSETSVRKQVRKRL